MITPSQKVILKAAILADSGANAFYVVGDQGGLAAYLNALFAPAFWVWRTSITKADLTNSVSVDGTTFTWVGNGFITRSAGEQAAWRELFSVDDGSVNASLANVRQAFSDIFSGTGNAAANRTHLLASARRPATWAEKVLATGTGTTASPAVMGFEGAVTTQDLVGL
jgi:hypothetical protein